MGLDRLVLATASALLLSSAAVSAAEPAGDQPPPRQRVVTMTRFVKIFNDHEYDLIDAVRAGDKGNLDRLVAADFEQRNAASPAVPVPRDDWMAANELKAPGQALVTELAVHDRGELAIASFRLKLKDRDLFIVDVWRRKGADAFELLTRYASPIAGTGNPPPVAPTGKR
ncbi:hypothetical protein [Ideonella sp.]|uniref:hypothetical protein n=1 Tax=Ideonella sp. TaxID=1929293 RepID=UPI0035AE51A2